MFQLLGIEHGEEAIVSMLLVQSIFLGIFCGAFDISAHSMFLAIFDVKLMAKAYVVSGIAMLLLTGLYTWLKAKVSFRNFAIINLIFVTILTLVLWMTLHLNPSKLIIFIAFVMLGPLNIMAILGFRDTNRQLFSLRQSYRITGLVEAGLITGIILSSYSIPVLLSVNFKSHNILLLSITSILVAALIQIPIGTRFNFQATVSGKLSENKSGLSIFTEDSYFRTMGIFVSLSVIAAYFVQYSFMAVTREQYPLEEDMARFLGFFTGSMIIFTLIIKVFVSSYLIRNYSLKTCLAATPVIVIGLTTIAIGTGMFMGYTPASGGFVLFFLLLALSRLFSVSFRDSVESPSFSVIYQTIEEKLRYKVQSGIEGTIKGISALASGLILSGFGALVFFKLIDFSLILFFILAAWIFVALKLYSEYRRATRKSLEMVSIAGADSVPKKGSRSLKSRIYGNRLFRINYFKLINGDLSLIDTSDNTWFLEQIIGYADTKQDMNLLPSLKRIAGKTGIDEVVRHKSAEVIDRLEITQGEPQKSAGPGLSETEDEKITSARRVLSGSRLPQTTEILRLLRDGNIESKRHAIYIIGKFRLTDMLHEVCECLNIPGLGTDVTSVIEHFGADASEELYRFYFGSGNINTCKLILRLICKSSIKEYPGFMFSRILSNSKPIKEAAVKCLTGHGYNLNDDEKDKLIQQILEIAGTITWNISAQACLAKNNNTFLLNVIKKETASWHKLLFNLLSIAYSPGSIMKIRENLDYGTYGSVNHALEMIDIVIDDHIKPMLISLLDVVSDEDKLKNLHQFFPVEIPVYEQLIEDIINRDYNLIGVWAKACTLRNLTKISGISLSESVVALLFSPEKIIQEEAARLIGRAKKDLYYSATGRIIPESKNRLDKIVSGEIPDEELLYEKTSFLSLVISGLPEEESLILAGTVKYVKDIHSITESELGNSILWNLRKDKSEIKVFLPDGIVGPGFSRNIIKSDDSFFYLLPVSALEEYQNNFPESALEIYKYVDVHEKNNS